MKKTVNKALSVILCVAVLVSCMVFAVPEASAQSAGNYYFRVTINVKDFTNGMDSGTYKYNTNNDGTCGMTIFCRTANGTGSQEQVDYDLRDIVKSTGTKQLTLHSPGYGVPHEMYAFANSDGWGFFGAGDDVKVVFAITKLEIGPSETQMTTAWTGEINVSSSGNPYGLSLSNYGSTQKTDHFNSHADDYITTSTDNWDAPVATNTTTAYSNSTLTCPKTATTASVTNNLTYTAKDKYGVVIDSTFSEVSVKSNVTNTAGNNGIITTNDQDGTDTTTVTFNANTVEAVEYQTVTATVKWSLNGSTKDTTATFRLYDALYTIKFGYKTTNPSDLANPTQNTVEASARYGAQATVPAGVIYSYYDASNHYTGTYNNPRLTSDVELLNLTYDAQAHSYTSNTTVPATCTSSGTTTYSCSCGYFYTDTASPAALGHRWNGGVVTKDASCTEKGVKTYTCLNDSSHTYSEELEALGHNYTFRTFAPTCTEDGYTLYTCSRCGNSYRDNVITALGHDWDEGVITLQPTATTPGIRTYTCKRDPSHTYTEEIAAKAMAQFKVSKVNGAAYTGNAPINSGAKIDVDVILSRDENAGVQTWAVGYAFDSEQLILNTVTYGTAWMSGSNQNKTTYYQIGGVAATPVKSASEVVATISFTVAEDFTGTAGIQTGFGQNFIGIKKDGASGITGESLNAFGTSFEVYSFVNKEALANAISAANELNRSNYTPSSWSVLETALTAANAVYDNGYALQSEVNSATETLLSAINALVGAADKTALTAIINRANIELEKDIYTAESLGALRTAVTIAKVVLDDAEATQSAVNTQTAKVTEAYNALKYNTLKVTFLNYDGSVFETQNVPYGGSATAPATNPVKPSDKVYNYLFASWSGDFKNVTSNISVTPTFTSSYIDYVITFKNEDGTTISTAKYHYGESVVLPASPEKAEDEIYTYDFSGWTPEVSEVTGNAEYIASYTPEYKNYTVRFENYDGSEFASVSLHWGDSVTAPEGTPVKPADKNNSYIFSGWSPEFAPVSGNAVYTAQFTAVANLYTVKFVNYDGTVISEQQYAIGETVVVPAENPSKPADDTYYYTFKEWSPAVVSVEGEAVYTATYTAHYVQADYSAVDAAEAAALALDADIYTETSYNRVAIALAGITRGITVDRQAEVDDMAAAINSAVAALVSTVDYDAVWAKCAAVNNNDNQFTAESYAAFTAAMNEIGAKQDFDTEEATQAEVDAAVKALKDAYDLLSASTLDIVGADEQILDDTALVIKANSSVAASQLSADDGGAGISQLRYIDADGNEISGRVLATGCKVQLIQGGEVKLEKYIVVYGDINGDGQVSIADIALARKLAVSTDGYGSLQVAAAQCGSGSVDVQNVIDIAKA